MGDTLSSLAWDEDNDGETDPSFYMDMERGDYENVQLRDEEFYRMQHARMAERFGTAEIDPRFFYGNCIRLERYHHKTSETIDFCWMPVDHIVAKLLICNPHLHHGLMEDSLQECPMVGCLAEDADRIISMIMERFWHYGLISTCPHAEDEEHDTESPPSPTMQNDSDDVHVWIPGFAPSRSEITILDPSNPPSSPWAPPKSVTLDANDPELEEVSLAVEEK